MIGRLWKSVRRVWAALALAFMAFLWWQTLPGEAAKAALASSIDVTVDRHAHGWSFAAPSRTGPCVVLIAGAMVDPRAYAALARDLADGGRAVLLIELPWRGFAGRVSPADLVDRIDGVRDGAEIEGRCVLGGHSLGGKLAAGLAAAAPDAWAGLLLLATSHPRDVDLSGLDLPALKLSGSEDGLASPGEIRATLDRMPDGARWQEIVGANHAGFADYGWQLGDGRATISGAEQRQQTVQAIEGWLATLSAEPGPRSP